MSCTTMWSSPSSSFIVCLASASDWAGFSPTTYSVRSSPRSIASNISVRCQPRLGLDGDAPGLLEPRPRLVVDFQILEAGEVLGDGAHVAAALHVVLAAQRVQPRAVAADVAGQQGQVDQRENVVDGVVVLGDAERPADHGAVGAGIGVGGLADRLGRHAGLALAPLQRPLLDAGGVRLVAFGGAIDELAVVQPGMDDLAGDRVRERDVGADIDPEPACRPTGRSRCGADRRRTGALRCSRL